MIRKAGATPSSIKLLILCIGVAISCRGGIWPAMADDRGAITGWQDFQLAQARGMQYLACEGLIHASEGDPNNGQHFGPMNYAFDGVAVYDVDNGYVQKNDVQIPTQLPGGMVQTEYHSNVTDTELTLITVTTYPSNDVQTFSTTISRFDLTYSVSTGVSGSCRIIPPPPKLKRAL